MSLANRLSEAMELTNEPLPLHEERRGGTSAADGSIRMSNDLHERIMNLPGAGGLSEIGTTHGEQLAYKRGHRDARHAAAELAIAHEATERRLAAEDEMADAEAQALAMLPAARAAQAQAKSCKTCKFLAVAPDARGRIVVRATRVYQCAYIVPMPPLPKSITSAYGFRWPPHRSYMTGDSGVLCPTWEARG